jgi:hypothetical protein
MSDPFKRYAEAVVHPFGNGAYGATLPDRFQELVVPVTDSLEFDLSPANLNYPSSIADWTQDDDTQLTGIFMWFQPRCLASGAITNRVLSGNTGAANTNAYIPVDDTFSESADDTILTAYQLCITGLWTYNGNIVGVPPISFGLYNGGTQALEFFVPAYLALQYSRFDNIASNCDKLRILGAGIKVWSEQAPINTGGYSIGGWMTLEDIRTAMARSETRAPLNPGNLSSISTSIKFRCRTPGVKGSTVRYSSLQSALQLRPQYPVVPQRLYQATFQDPNSSNPIYADALASPYVIDESKSSEIAVNDLMTPGSYVPVIYWHFNVSDSSNNDNVSNVYTLKVMSMVHSECTPTGTCPFMTGKSSADPAVEHVKLMLENVEQFPAAVSGHSFKSFVTKASHIVGKINKYASKTAKIMQLVEKLF